MSRLGKRPIAEKILNDLIYNHNFGPARLQKEADQYKPSDMRKKEWDKLVEDYINNMSSA